MFPSLVRRPRIPQTLQLHEAGNLKADSSTLILVTSSYPIAADGSEAAGAFVKDVAEELAKRTTVRVVAPGKHDTFERVTPTLQVFRYTAPSRPLSTLRVWNPVDAVQIYRVMRSGGRRILAASDIEGPGHILALWALPCGQWARKASRRTGLPFSVWALGSDIWSMGRIPLVRQWLRIVLNQADTLLSDGLRLAEDTQSICSKQVEFLPSTRRIEKSNPQRPRSSPPYRFVFIGRWHKNKGIDMLIDALESLNEREWQCIRGIAIFGGGPLAAAVDAGVRRLQLRGRPVETGGYLKKSDAVKEICRADYVLIPSRIESIPLIFSDAMKLQRPVIATPVGDLPRLVSAFKCGILATSVSIPALSAAIVEAAQSQTTQFNSGIDSAAKEFSIPGTIAPRLLNLLK